MGLMGRLAWCAVGLAMLASAACAQDQTAGAQQAPDFTLQQLNGENLSLSDYRGRVVILDFWATWCPPCREEIPHFVELQTAYGDRGLTIIGVSLDQGGSEVVEGFARTHGINYPLVMGNQRVADAYGGIRGIPTTFVIDREGRIVSKYVGYRPKDVFERDIQELL